MDFRPFSLPEKMTRKYTILCSNTLGAQKKRQSATGERLTVIRTGDPDRAKGADSAESTPFQPTWLPAPHYHVIPRVTVSPRHRTLTSSRKNHEGCPTP